MAFVQFVASEPYVEPAVTKPEIVYDKFWLERLDIKAPNATGANVVLVANFRPARDIPVLDGNGDPVLDGNGDAVMTKEMNLKAKPIIMRITDLFALAAQDEVLAGTMNALLVEINRQAVARGIF